MTPLAPRDDLKALEGYHSPQIDVAVRLNTNESPYPPPPDFVAAWLDALSRIPLNRYPDRAATELRAGLAAHLDQPIERIFCANGSNEVLQTIFLTYGGPGRRAAVFEPTYALHAHIARISGTELVVGERGADFAVDPVEARRVLRESSPHLVFLCSPNNPTGTVESRAAIDAVRDSAPGFVVVDEAYGEFAPWSALELGVDAPNVIVVRTYSKVWSMAALRLGFCVASPDVVEELQKVVLPYHLAAPTQLAGVEALRFGVEMDERIAALVGERERMRAELGPMDGVTVFESGANFLLIRVEGDGHAVWSALVERGVLVRDFSRWPRLAECLRVTVGSPTENDSFLGALREVLQEKRRA